MNASAILKDLQVKEWYMYLKILLKLQYPLGLDL